MFEARVRVAKVTGASGLAVEGGEEYSEEVRDDTHGRGGGWGRGVTVEG
jgi:hypothetical protein